MTRGSRKKKVNKRRKSLTVVSPSANTVESAPLPSGLAKLQPGKTVFASKDILIGAPLDSCFNILAMQLEQTPEWDPMIIDSQPVSENRRRIGATSQVTLNLGGRRIESLAMIYRYRPKRAISWVLATKPKVREDWYLERKRRGTMVRVTLAYEVNSWAIRLIYKLRHHKRVEQDLRKVLIQLKRTAENISHS